MNRISVVIPTYNRPERLRRLLLQLGAQTMPPSEFEVVVIDDGSRSPPPDLVVPYRLTLLRQENRGAAVARHAGATAATADIVVFLDDDMEVSPALLEEHARIHDGDPRAVVLGWVKLPDTSDLPLFERFHGHVLDELAREVRTGRQSLRGPDVYSGNLSLRRSLYIKVGGFDPALGLSEDAELGVRLEKAGATFYLSDEAQSIQHSDHASVGAWMKRSFRYGAFDHRISRKHPDVRHASPWRYASIVPPLTRPFFVLALVAPRPAHLVARAVMGLATSLDGLGLESAALAGATLAFGMEYTRGLRDEAGGLRASVRDLVRYLRPERHRSE